MSLFSAKHIQFQKQVHEECPAYGVASQVFAPMVSELINANQVKTLLDYGSGQGSVPQNLELNHRIDVQLYDPAIEKFEDSPNPAEMVICLDVLDAVEPECIDAILDDIKRLTNKIAFLSINTKVREDLQVPDATQRELKQVEWWLPKLMERFELHYFSRIDNGFVVVLKATAEAPLQ